MDEPEILWNGSIIEIPPRLYAVRTLAAEYLAPQLSQAQAEREFSRLKILLDSKKTALLDENKQMIVCLSQKN